MCGTCVGSRVWHTSFTYIHTLYIRMAHMHMIYARCYIYKHMLVCTHAYDIYTLLYIHTNASNASSVCMYAHMVYTHYEFYTLLTYIHTKIYTHIMRVRELPAAAPAPPGYDSAIFFKFSKLSGPN
jgi:hypothetical protein